ncbi:hypothetical protein [Altericroceibacterium endophyticum]|uniref:Uncharacterized protein n=1 Tax=Altericroceibacterium endophyticum TaxID=1808508 RepID=A0A6I4T4M1_9SPHN|nr:hypothetical protein [Altericroceibacterium endophyticum]MXO65847.1 hypothetical protein [Altericroceibacterium endophyticum]
MTFRFAVLFAAFTTAYPVHAEDPLKAGFAGALRGCEEWVLNPASWAEGVEPFIATIGLGNRMGLVESVDAAALPPEKLRVANHYWRINSTDEAGYILVVSDRLPMCHITGGGGEDLQPTVEAVINQREFRRRWEVLETRSAGGMVSTTYRNREEPAFSMIVSRANESGQRLDRVQVIATAIYNPAN